jgi:hypothetical protein
MTHLFMIYLKTLSVASGYTCIDTSDGTIGERHEKDLESGDYGLI